MRDLHLRGGDAFTYALKAVRAEPYFTLHADLDKVLVPAGVGGQVFVKAVRKNGFAGEIQLKVEDLPPGVRAECGRILADGQDGTILFYAEPGTKPSAAIARIVGTAVRPWTTIEIRTTRPTTAHSSAASSNTVRPSANAR